ncbi:hypothetical protein C0989_007322, partial [Termitomyces sp. Mn162]
IEGVKEKEGELVISFVDDVVVAAEGNGMEEAVRGVKRIMEQDSRARRWATNTFLAIQDEEVYGSGVLEEEGEDKKVSGQVRASAEAKYQDCRGQHSSETGTQVLGSVGGPGIKVLRTHHICT